MTAGIFRKFVLCRFRLCATFRTEGNDTHLWGECTVCGKRVGEISREAIRRYMRAQELDALATTNQSSRSKG